MKIELQVERLYNQLGDYTDTPNMAPKQQSIIYQNDEIIYLFYLIKGRPLIHEVKNVSLILDSLPVSLF